MRSMIRSIILLVIAALSLSACGGGGGGGSTPPPPPPPTTDWQGVLITSPSVSPVTAFMQSAPTDTSSTYYEIFPGQANVWTISDYDFSAVDSLGNQFWYAMDITVGTTNLFQEVNGGFINPQLYSELTFYTPSMTAADGVKVAAVSDGSTIGLSSTFPTDVASTLSGSYAAFLTATSDSRLQKTHDLRTVTTPTVTITWTDAVSVDPGMMSGYTPSYRVVIRSENGTLLRTLFSAPSGTRQVHTDTLNEFVGQKIVLSFEERSSTPAISIRSLPYAIIDDVSVKDGNNNEYVINGDFETGTLVSTPVGSSWTTNTPQEVQNMTSGSRNLEGLDVKRSFYAAPNKLWGRWVDVFSNNTGAAISKTVTYETQLGSGGGGVIYSSTSGTKSLTAWDDRVNNPTGSRDLGWVFGNASTVNFTSDDGTGSGSDLIDVAFNITVPAGGKVALVNFIIMNGHDTGGDAPTGYSSSKKASAIDAVAADIASHFWDDPQHQYLRGVTQQQVDAIKNF